MIAVFSVSLDQGLGAQMTAAAPICAWMTAVVPNVFGSSPVGPDDCSGATYLLNLGACAWMGQCEFISTYHHRVVCSGPSNIASESLSPLSMFVLLNCASAQILHRARVLRCCSSISGHTWRCTHCICIASALLCVGLRCVAAHLVASGCSAAMSGHCTACVPPTVMCVELFCAAWSAFRMNVAFHCPSCWGCALLIRRQGLHSGRARFILLRRCRACPPPRWEV